MPVAFSMNYQIRNIIRHILFALTYGVVIAMLIGLGIYVYLLEGRPDLKVWHSAELDEEFTADRIEDVPDLAAYLALEQRLMQQVKERVYDRIPSSDQRTLVRYHQGSLTDPESQPKNWNRTFELIPERPIAGALLIHGLSDSPYSMRAIAKILYQHNVQSLAMRMPGHGTAPTGLVDVHWQDFVAAVRIGLKHLQQRVKKGPIYIVGYSNGAALAIEYALMPLEGIMMPQVDALVLLSPAIGVSPVAALARWQGRLGNLIGMGKLAWSSIQSEFDPYKYNSFTVNAGDQIFQLTSAIEQRIQNLSTGHGLKHFPRTIAFQSVVDATVPVEALLDKFFMKLEPDGHELVLFDVNRFTEAEPLLRNDPETLIQTLLEKPSLPFDLSIVTNRNSTTKEVMARIKIAQTPIIQDQQLDLSWPVEIFSLSHVAIPFPPDDSLYGSQHDPNDKGITLGAVTIRGERNLLQVPDSYFVRLRHNPFFAYMVARILEFLRLDVPDQN